MKYDSLNWQQQKALVKMYDERHADEIPVEPTSFEEPSQSPRVMVPAQHTTHVYAFMRENNRAPHPASEGCLRIIGASEHLEITIERDSIPKLISELQRLYDDMSSYDAEGRAHAERWRKYRDAKSDYEAKREQSLKKAFASGKYTEKMIQDMIDRFDIGERALDDIPF